MIFRPVVIGIVILDCHVIAEETIKHIFTGLILKSVSHDFQVNKFRLIVLIQHDGSGIKQHIRIGLIQQHQIVTFLIVFLNGDDQVLRAVGFQVAASSCTFFQFRYGRKVAEGFL